MITIWNPTHSQICKINEFVDWTRSKIQGFVVLRFRYGSQIRPAARMLFWKIIKLQVLNFKRQNTNPNFSLFTPSRQRPRHSPSRRPSDPSVDDHSSSLRNVSPLFYHSSSLRFSAFFFFPKHRMCKKQRISASSLKFVPVYSLIHFLKF